MIMITVSALHWNHKADPTFDRPTQVNPEYIVYMQRVKRQIPKNLEKINSEFDEREVTSLVLKGYNLDVTETPAEINEMVNQAEFDQEAFLQGARNFQDQKDK